MEQKKILQIKVLLNLHLIWWIQDFEDIQAFQAFQNQSRLIKNPENKVLIHSKEMIHKKNSSKNLK